MKRARFGVRVICFCLVLCLLLNKYYTYITPEFYTNTWPTTSTYDTFYDLNKNSVDVLFFGSSHGVSGFMPQELYNNYGITAYNLSCEQQNLITTYFWLREALKYQSPKAVIIDCYICFPYNTSEALNSSEVCTRKAFDAMRWSMNKVEAVNTICELDEKQSKLSYYFPNIRYHDRWESIGRNDWIHDKMMGYANLMGSWALNYGCGIEFDGYDIDADTGTSEMVPLMQEYLEKIEALCAENNIELILTINPMRLAIERCKYLEEYSASKGLRCIDFDRYEIFNQIDYDFANDNADGTHLNLWGAQKVTNFIGEILSTEYGLGGHYDAQWENAKQFYAYKCKECSLKRATTIEEYLSDLDSPYLTVVISAKDEASNSLSDTAKECLKALGITSDLTGQYRSSFVAVIDKQNIVYDSISSSKIETSSYINDGLTLLEVSSAGYDCGNMSSIKIGGKEYSKNSRGLNIVVYSNESESVIDAVCFDTFDSANTMAR